MNPLYEGYGVGVAQVSAWGQEAAMAMGAALMEVRREVVRREVVRREAARMTGLVDELSGLLSKCTVEEDSSFDRSPVRMQSIIRGDIQGRSCTERSLARMQRTMGEHGHIQSRSSSTERWSLPRKEVWMNESREKEGRWECEYALMSTRHEKSHNTKSKTGKSALYLPRIPSVVREQKLYNRNEYVRYT